MPAYLATFHTHCDALIFMRLLKALNITGKLAPVPRSLSSSCGVCALFQSDGPLEPFRDAEIERLLRQEGKSYVLLIDKR